MRYIGQFRVGVATDSSPEATIVDQIGACGTFTNTLLALAASQGLEGRVISMLNFPAGDGHALAEIFADGKWRLYDPTYGAYYVNRWRPEDGALSFDEVKSAYSTGAFEVRREVLIYRPGLERFTGKDIFVGAYPSGVIGPDRPMYFPLSLNAYDFPELIKDDFGPRFQGANFLGAASTNQNQEWVIEGLVSGEVYVFVVEPEYLGGDITKDDDYQFLLSAEIKGGRELKGERLHSFDFSKKSVSPWNIRFLAESSSVRIVLSHRYLGPAFRYINMKRYKIEKVDGDNS